MVTGRARSVPRSKTVASWFVALALAGASLSCTAEEDEVSVTPIVGGKRAGGSGGVAGGGAGKSGTAGRGGVPQGVAGTTGKSGISTGGSGGSGAGGSGGSSGAAGVKAQVGGASQAGGASQGGGGVAGKTGGPGGAGAGGMGTAGTGPVAGTGGVPSAGGSPSNAGADGGAGKGVPPDPPPALSEVHASGRFQATPAGLRSSWSGSSFTSTFSGTGISVVFDAAGSSTDYEIIVDGERRAENKIELTAGEKSYPVVSGLPPGQHTVTVHRRTEASTGATIFKGFQVIGGALVPTPSPFLHRVEFVGDSITCGYGTECKTAAEAFSTKTENHWLTFGAGASRALSADAHFVAWSGKGMFHNYGNEASAKMPELFPRTIGGEAETAWDFASWKPEVVVINLGTNDWNGGIDTAPEIEAFKTAYRAFIDTVAGHYPGVVIFGIGNAIVGKSHTDAIKAIMEGYGSPTRRYLLFAVKASEGQGCYHPTAATHARWSSELAAAIKDATGW